jgi:phage repressor protein C with HTH and peptisase S24 domain
MNREFIGNRLRQAREKANLSRDHVTAIKDIGISRTTLQQWEMGQREASLETLAKLAKLYQVSPQWLIFGEGDSTAQAPAPATNPSLEAPAKHVIFDEEFVLIPMYDIEVSAGNGLFSQGVTEPIKHVAYRKDWIKSKGLDPYHLAVVCNNGDSMETTIPNGSCMLINLLKNQAFDGNIYIIRLDDRIFVKRTQWIPTGGLRIISDNPIYEPFDLDKAYLASGQFEVCGEVIEISHIIH